MQQLTNKAILFIRKDEEATQLTKYKCSDNAAIKVIMLINFNCQKNIPLVYYVVEANKISGDHSLLIFFSMPPEQNIF